MKFLSCLVCSGELEVINNDEPTSHKKIKCRKCGFGSVEHKKEPEIIVRRRN